MSWLTHRRSWRSEFVYCLAAGCSMATDAVGRFRPRRLAFRLRPRLLHQVDQTVERRRTAPFCSCLRRVEQRAGLEAPGRSGRCCMPKASDGSCRRLNSDWRKRWLVTARPGTAALFPDRAAAADSSFPKQDAEETRWSFQARVPSRPWAAVRFCAALLEVSVAR